MEESLEAQSCVRQYRHECGVGGREAVRELTIRQQVMAATAGGIATALFVTPFDVVKTRLQAQFDPLTSPNRTASTRPHTVAPLHFSGTKDAFTKIVRVEGIRALWRGLTPALLLTVPANSLYFMMYDRTKNRIERSSPGLAAPVFAGLVARTVTVCFTAPLELMRTYVQSHSKSAAHMQKGVVHITADIVRTRGILHLWVGLAPTLWRDVPFSIIYWSAYEYIKQAITRPEQTNSTFLLTFTSGAGAGCLAASLTTPIDVVKTRRQMSIGSTTPAYPPSSRAILLAVVREEGMRGLFKGIVPRTAKVAPACALMIASYEFFKQLFLEPPPSSSPRRLTKAST